MPPTAITVPVEQDSGAARLEAAEQRLPETLDPESLRKYFTLTETDLQELAVCRGVVSLIKSGDVTVTHSRRWTDFEDYLIPRVTWAKEREQHYAKLGLPLQGEQYLVQLRAQLAAVTAEVDRRVPGNSALSIDAQKGEFHLAALKGADKPDEVKTLKELIESRLPRTELVNVLIDMDHRTDFLRHFLHYGAGESR